MKIFSLLVAAFLLSPPALWGATPFNLEGIEALNVLVIDENKAISEQLENRIRSEIKRKLQMNGIKSEKESVGALFVKIYTTRTADTSVVYINFGVGEESRIQRSKEVESFAVSYSNYDMVESRDIESDVYDSIINYLMEEFLEQFHEDNEA